MKNQTESNRIKVYSFLKENRPNSFSPLQIERATGIKNPALDKAIKNLFYLDKIKIAKQEQHPITKAIINYYEAIAGRQDMTSVFGDYRKKPGRRSTITQGIAWATIERDPGRYSQIQKVYSFLLAHQQKCFSRRQLEETLKIRCNSMTSVLKDLLDKKLVGIEDKKVCEYTGEEVYFYYGIDPTQEPQRKLF